MARTVSILATHTKAINDITILEKYYSGCITLPPNMQELVSETIMLRLFSILETCIRETSIKVACGGKYRSGLISSPILLCKSKDRALEQFKTYNRTKALQNLRFTNVSSTNDSIKYIIDSLEPFRVNLNHFGVEIEEMRKVRNHIAHRYRSTYVDFKSVILSRYGAFVKIRPGVFLLSTKRSTQPILEEYLIKTKVIINEITKG